MACVPKKSLPAMIEAVKLARGVLTIAAEHLGVSRQCMTKYVEKYPKLKKVVEEQRSELADRAEDILFDEMQKGKEWAVKMVLYAHAKDRGYGNNSFINVEAKSDTTTLLLKLSNGKDNGKETE